MKPWLARLAARCTSALRSTDRRISWLERALQMPLTDSEADRLRMACHEDGVKLGRFYHWKIEQLALISCMRGMDRQRFLALVSRVDDTDYSPLDAFVAERGCGLLLATPHHGHFVLSIIAAAERLREHRRVSIFYESPSAHSSNAVFDAAYACLFGSGSTVSVIHNTRAGLVQAIRELRAGQVVIIMPDVYRNAEDTWQVPFCGGQRNVMLGTAVLARRTGAVIVPMVSRTGTSLFGFRSCFAAGITAAAESPGSITETYVDYTTTVQLFEALETPMRGQLHAWQYTRGHHVHAHQSQSLDTSEMLELGELLLTDPRTQLRPTTPLVSAT